MRPASKITIQAINLYQRTLSPDHGSWATPFSGYACKFYPSCSEYTKKAIIQNGLGRGVIKAFWRILRCNPLSAGGYDPV